VIVFPNCKINLGLYILRKREDGFHDLETVFYPVPLQDALEVITDHEGTQTSMNVTGLALDGKTEDNICLKAYELLKKDFPSLPPIQIHLHKVIPAGAGLGGGSADGAFMLLLLNKKSSLDLSESQLINYALQLGSDCPFFIKNQPCFATKRGENMQEISMDLSAYQLVLVNPQIHVNTGWAFAQVTPIDNRPSIKQIVEQPVTKWKDELKNDFEAPVFRHHPEIKSIKEALYQQGALYAAMSGSGSTVYGIFPKEKVLSLSFPPHYFVHKAT
jgi:4-diphosphocytidyl-2-C-methyl-D-erythritol kinase